MDIYKQYRTKLITIIVLCILILIGLIILNFKGCSSSKKEPEPTPTPEPTVIPTPTPTPTPEPTPEVPAVDLESDDSLTRYVSQTHPISETYVPADMRTVNVHSAEAKKLREEAATKLEEMFQAAISDRIYLKLVDGYRSYQLQADLFSYYTQTRGAYYASIVDDHPGASEHQLGLCVDILDRNRSRLVYEDMNQELFAWLDEHCAEYGFIKRYPENKISITGRYEPWHIRYVGTAAAEFMKLHDLCLEEFVNLY
jgi:D-alanyl-D-alanine carboxypeptidase